jgi:hypothetical protein
VHDIIKQVAGLITIRDKTMEELETRKGEIQGLVGVSCYIIADQGFDCGTAGGGLEAAAGSLHCVQH